MANSFGDTVSDLDYARQRWQSWQAQAEQLQAELDAARAQIAAMQGVVETAKALTAPHLVKPYKWLKVELIRALAALSSAENETP